MNEQQENKSPLLNEVGWSFGGIILGIVFVAIILFALNYFSIINLSSLYPQWFSNLPQRISPQPQTTLPQPTTEQPQPTQPIVTSANLESCDVKKEGNPLVEDVETLNIEGQEIVVGNFRGNINNVTLSEDKQTAQVEVVAPRGDQTHTFSLREQNGLVYDMTSGEDGTLADLAKGQVVTISFDCAQNAQKVKEFKLTRFTITGKL